MSLTFTPRHALVCAASSGLGLAVAKSLLEAGHSVVIVARGEARLAAAREELIRSGGPGTADRLDVAAIDLTQPDQIARLWRHATRHHPVEILVTNTGGPRPGAFTELNDADWHAAMESVLLSVVRLARLALPTMRERAWGRIVTITSSSGKEPIPGLMLSNVLRAGVAALVKTLAREEAAHGITVNNVCPGMTDTARLGELFVARARRSGRTPEEERAAALEAMPRGTFNTPAEFAAAVRWLVSDDAAGVSGVSLFVDGASSRSTF